MSADGMNADGMSADPARILVVEDSATQAEALRSLLVKHGYVADVARTGERALEMVERDEYQLILSDVVMPGISGFDVCRQIREQSNRPDTPIVILTSLADPLDILRGLECGADNYITKPFDDDALLARIGYVLASRGRRSESRHDTRAVNVSLRGQSFSVAAPKERILDLLVSNYEDLVRTTQTIREAEAQARFLAEASELLSSSLDHAVILRNLAQLAVPSIADVCAVDELDDGGCCNRVAIAVAVGDTADEQLTAALRVYRPPTDRPSLVSRALTSMRPELVPDISVLERDPMLDDAAHVSMLRALGVRSIIVVPLVARGHALGALTLATASSGRVYTHDDRMLATDLARRGALAVDNSRLYNDAQQATRARDDILAVVSHDLRNPIHTIQLSASFLLEALADPAGAEPPLVQQLNVIRRAALRGNALIQDLLDVTRIETGRLPIEPFGISAPALLTEIVTEMLPLVGEKEIVLESIWNGPAALVCADRQRVGQVFSNLVGNAIKFTPRGGRIVLGGELKGGMVEFSVTDSGSGVPVAHIPHLFDRFWQAKSTARQGAGLGLSIVKGIVEAHGGSVAVTSVVDEGSTFRFTLRRASAAGVACPGDTPAADDSATS
ncbi:MAG: ATP-binding response regulator [Gemmatimonadaceae bacterium]